MAHVHGMLVLAISWELRLGCGPGVLMPLHRLLGQAGQLGSKSECL